MREDDILLWRMVFLYMVANYVSKARSHSQVHFALEQPASPQEYMPQTVSFWDTKQWKELKAEFNFEEITFEQKRMGGPATKPTTVAGTLELDAGDDRWTKGKSYAKISNSKALARWPPGLMHMMATAIVEQVLHQEVPIKALSWQEHLAYNHLPYRRDCRVCQESLQQADLHRRVRNPMGGILSIDVAGPMKPAYDQGGGQARWILLGALSWRVPRGSTKMKQPTEEALEADVPEIEEGRAEEEDRAEEEGQEEESERQQQGEVGGGVSRGGGDPGNRPPGGDGRQGGGDPGNRPPPGRGVSRGGGDPGNRLPGEGAREGEEDPAQLPPNIEEETELRVFRMALPMVTKTAKP